MIVQLTSMLLIYLTPAETYHVLKALINSSLQAFQSYEDKMLMRWHFTFEKNEYFKMLTTFIKSYLSTTLRKKRSILSHLNKIGFDFSLYVDKAFKSIMAYFVPINVGVDIMMMFLTEGVKIIFRYTYAIMKLQKEFVK